MTEHEQIIKKYSDDVQEIARQSFYETGGFDPHCLGHLQSEALHNITKVFELTGVTFRDLTRFPNWQFDVADAHDSIFEEAKRSILTILSTFFDFAYDWHKYVKSPLGGGAE